jgi:hypothetical protein
MDDIKLPKQILPIYSCDKNRYEKWTKTRDPLNIPKPFRISLTSRPGMGKTLTIKNILIRCTPEFEAVYLLHCDGQGLEYVNDVDIEVLDELPEIEFWDDLDEDGNRSHKLLIIDDVDFSLFNKKQKHVLDRTLGFVSTHWNLSICVAGQNFFSLPPIIRKCVNMFIIWSPTDLDELNIISRRCGIPSKKLKALFQKHITKESDSLWIDMTTRSPYPLRVNGYQLIDL